MIDEPDVQALAGKVGRQGIGRQLGPGVREFVCGTLYVQQNEATKWFEVLQIPEKSGEKSGEIVGMYFREFGEAVEWAEGRCAEGVHNRRVEGG